MSAILTSISSSSIQPSQIHNTESYSQPHNQGLANRIRTATSNCFAILGSFFSTTGRQENRHPVENQLVTNRTITTEALAWSDIDRESEAQALIKFYDALPLHFKPSFQGTPRERAGAIQRWLYTSWRARTLTELDLSGKGLSSLPPEITLFRGVTSLNLSGNKINKLPASISHLTTLRILNLQDNCFTNIPEELYNSTTLAQLNLSNNSLSGEIPAKLGNLTNLRFVDLNDNQLSGPIPTEICALTKLRELNLSNNQLTGAIPENIGNLKTLTVLRLENNKLHGEIPASMYNLSNLQGLRLDNNQLTGAIPESIRNLKTLRILVLRGNRFSGKFPTPVMALEYLDLSRNNFNVQETRESLRNFNEVRHLVINTRLVEPIEIEGRDNILNWLEKPLW